MIAATLLLAAAGASGAPATASSICVYNKAWFVLKWHQASDAGAVSEETSTYPVGQVKCQTVMASGTKVYPVVKAILGKEIQAADAVVYDPVNATQITYVCTGTTLDFSCEQGPMPPTAANVTKAVGEFLLGFTDGLGEEIGFADCLSDVDATFHDIVTIVQKLEEGFQQKDIAAIVAAFELMGGMIKDFSAAIAACVKDAKDIVAKFKDLAAALSGNVLSILKVIVEDAIHIFRERKEITADAKAVSADWQAGDYQGSGKAVGDIVGIIINGL